MKRSQMIERIYEMLNCDGVLEYSMPTVEPVKLTEDHIRQIAKWCLDEVEGAGMLPPTVYLSSSGDYMPTVDLLDEANIDYECEWEAE